MNPQQIINELAKQIANETVAVQLKYWAALIFIVVVVSAAGAWIGSYFSKRGEAKALKDGFEDIRQQLAKTTSTVETIKTEIAHDDWLTREFKTLRRVKLESVMTLISESSIYLRAVFNQYMFEGPPPELLTPADKIMSLARLYFPEVCETARAFEQAFDIYIIACMQAGLDLSPLTIEQKVEKREELSRSLLDMHQQCLDARTPLELAAMNLVPTVIGKLAQ